MSRAEYIWAHMAARYGHAWASQYGEEPNGLAGRAWSDDLHGLTRAQLDTGIAACSREAKDFPPNPGQFRAMCFGIPPFAQVSHELLTKLNAVRSPFSRLVWRYLDGYAHRHAPAKEAERLRRTAYDLAMQHVMRGEPWLEPVAGEIEHKPEPKPADIPPTREARIERMRELLGDQFSERAANREVPA